jgi:tRNA pseudouridine55 synthase
MDGVLVVDKPSGVTSHDVVAVARRALREKRIGHTGTLDPLATGVLALACGRATRLVRFLSAADKDYEATIRFGVTTDSFDISGAVVSQSGLAPVREEVERGLAALRGEYDQMPPAYSAKRVGSERAYTLARRNQAVALKAVPINVSRAELVAFSGGLAVVALTCSAGFYVRTFAHTLGQLAGTGACLEALRRTRSGDYTLDSALPLGDLVTQGDRAGRHVVPLDALLPGIPAVRLTDEGRRRVTHGREIEPAHVETWVAPAPVAAGPAWVRLLDFTGCLVGLATRRTADPALHPAIVLI